MQTGVNCQYGGKLDVQDVICGIPKEAPAI